MQGTADLHQAFADARLAEAARVVDDVTAFDAAVDVLDVHTTAGDTPRLAVFARTREGSATRLPDGHDANAVGVNSRAVVLEKFS